GQVAEQPHMPLGHQQRMPAEQRPVVEERDQPLRLEHGLGGLLPPDNGAESTGSRHRHQASLPAVPIPVFHQAERGCLPAPLPIPCRPPRLPRLPAVPPRSPARAPLPPCRPGLPPRSPSRLPPRSPAPALPHPPARPRFPAAPLRPVRHPSVRTTGTIDTKDP